MEVLDLNATSRAAQAEHEKLVFDAEVSRRARTIHVPTSVDDVKRALRHLGQPVTLFGERAFDRRQRLRNVLAAKAVEGSEAELSALGFRGLEETAAAPESELDPSKRLEVFYTPAGKELQQARGRISELSFRKAKLRLSRFKRRRETPEEAHDRCRKLYEELRALGIRGSQIVDSRPVSCCKFSPLSGEDAAAAELEATRVATGAWTGLLKVWDAARLQPTVVCRGHTERVVGCDWHPGAHFTSQLSSDPEVYDSPRILASASADATVKLWDTRLHTARVIGEKPVSQIKSEPDAMELEAPTPKKQGIVERGALCLGTLTGHKARLSKVAFHVMGRYVGSTSFDHTWRLWDVETQKELQLQDGHLKPVYGIAFHPDGGLVATTDLFGITLLWDLRSGKQIHKCIGHVKRVLCVDFSPEGWKMVTAGDDHAVKIWDLRERRCLYTIPAHANLVTSVRYCSRSGEALMSSSFDGKAKMWSTRDYSCLQTLTGHEGKVMSGDISSTERHLATVGFDRTLKIWARDLLA